MKIFEVTDPKPLSEQGEYTASPGGILIPAARNVAKTPTTPTPAAAPTIRTAPAAAGTSFKSVAKSFAKDLGKKVVSGILGFDPGKYQNPDPAKGRAQMQAAMAQLADYMNQSWSPMVAQVMAQSKDDTGKIGVPDFRQIDKNLLAQEFIQQVNTIVNKLSNRRFQTIDDLEKISDTSVPVDSRQQLATAKSQVSTAINQIPTINPTKENSKKLHDLWYTLIDGIGQISQMKTGTESAQGNIGYILAKVSAGQTLTPQEKAVVDKLAAYTKT